MKEGLVLQSGAGPRAWAGGAQRAAGSGLWRRNVHRCGGLGLAICCPVLAGLKVSSMPLTGKRFLGAGDSSAHPGMVASSLLVMLGTLFHGECTSGDWGKGGEQVNTEIQEELIVTESLPCARHWAYVTSLNLNWNRLLGGRTGE